MRVSRKTAIRPREPGPEHASSETGAMVGDGWTAITVCHRFIELDGLVLIGAGTAHSAYPFRRLLATSAPGYESPLKR